jgi:transcriptional regulator with XRE-family HTH domain
LAAEEIRGVLLQRLRWEAGLTRSEVARRVGVWDSASVAAWERGRHQPAPANVPLLAAALRVEPLDLFEVTDIPSLSVLRRAAGLTLTQLAAKAGLSYARCQRIENGCVEASVEDITRLASAVGATRPRLRAATRAARQATAATRNPSTSAGP